MLTEFDNNGNVLMIGRHNKLCDKQFYYNDNNSLALVVTRVDDIAGSECITSIHHDRHGLISSVKHIEFPKG